MNMVHTCNTPSRCSIAARRKIINIILTVLLAAAGSQRLSAQGTWTPVSALSDYYNSGVMLLLSNGSVMSLSTSGSAYYGNSWDLLTPDSLGSYTNGTWRVLSDMANTRLYCSSQVLRDGRVYVGGGEYGTGLDNGELYDPVADTWTPAGPLPAGDSIFDSNSEMLPDGRVLQAVARHNPYVYDRGTVIYNPATNSYSNGPECLKMLGESSLVKLADNSLLYIDWMDTTSERYIPSTNSWIADGHVPVNIFDFTAYETGPAILLPDGRAFVIGGNGNTAYYTPSGSTSPGTWAKGPTVPNGQGCPDASAAVMTNGKILVATSDTPSYMNYFPSPMSFYEFDYVTNTFTRIPGPYGLDTLSGPCFYSHMLSLPDGNMLFSFSNTQQYFIYKPNGTPLTAGKPTIDSIIKINCDTFMATGKLFNGLNEGCYYGDDWQMSTNYPIIRLSNASGAVHYTRTYNWNSTGVMRGNKKDTTFFILPVDLRKGTYSMEVVANGNPSNKKTFKTCGTTGIDNPEKANETYLSVYPNPATGYAVVTFNSSAEQHYTIDLQDLPGRRWREETGTCTKGRNTHLLHLTGIAKGIYYVVLNDGTGTYYQKLVVE
jgi:hypothetical protein